MLYRRFGWIHALLLLHGQDELRELEDKLHELNKRDAKSKEGERRLQSRQWDESHETIKEIPNMESRKSLLGRIEDKTLKYGVL